MVVLSIVLRAWCGEPLERHLSSSLPFSNKAVIDSAMLGRRREQTASRRKLLRSSLVRGRVGEDRISTGLEIMGDGGLESRSWKKAQKLFTIFTAE